MVNNDPTLVEMFQKKKQFLTTKSIQPRLKAESVLPNDGYMIQACRDSGVMSDI